MTDAQTTSGQAVLGLMGKVTECGGLNKNGLHRLLYLKLSDQGVELFGRTRRIRRMTLLCEKCHFEISKAHTKSSVSLSSFGSGCRSQLLL